MSFQDRTHGSFTAVNDSAVEKRLADALENIGKEIAEIDPPHLAGVYLGGGYGRGEGGVLRTADGVSHLYNDMDFFVIREEGQGSASVIDDSLTGISRKWSEELELDVDFSSAKTPSELARLSPRLMYQELRRGHCLVYGKPGLLDCIPERPASALPFSEALRLLLNRGMGLLFASEKLASPIPQTDTGFILRNLHKAALGSGDAVMMSKGVYGWTARERKDIFHKLSIEIRLPEDYIKLYDYALDFKFLPTTELPGNSLVVWRGLRDFWCDSVCHVAEVSKTTDDEVCKALKKACGRHGESTFRQMARHCVRAKTLWPALTLNFTPPEALLLGRLYCLLKNATDFPRRERRLFKRWKIFN
ncbi:MAG: hypothetical protein J6X55_16500 [Victivallales bacterium]|nr:hypothetical protein [Victivallales bacterium]